MAPCSPCERKTFHLLCQDHKVNNKGWTYFCQQDGEFGDELPEGKGIIIKLSVNITYKQANMDQSYMKASKLNSTGAKISHICISAFDILG